MRSSAAVRSAIPAAFSRSTQRTRRACSAARAAAAAGKADVAGDGGDGPDAGGELAVVAGDEQDLIFTAGVDGERHVHGGEDDGVVEGDEEEARQLTFPSRGARLLRTQQ